MTRPVFSWFFVVFNKIIKRNTNSDACRQRRDGHYCMYTDGYVHIKKMKRKYCYMRHLGTMLEGNAQIRGKIDIEI